MSLRLLVVGSSEQNTRPENQDRISPPSTQLPMLTTLPVHLAVADGMGGSSGGSRAAEIATEHIPLLTRPPKLLQLFEQHPLPDFPHDTHSSPSPPTLPDFLELYFKYVNAKIIHEAQGPGVMGSTLSLLSLTEQRLWLTHIGDSRVYLWRGGLLHQLTQDDDTIAEYKRKGCLLFTPDALPLSHELRLKFEQKQWSCAHLYYQPQPEDKQILQQRGLPGLLEYRLSTDLDLLAQDERIGVVVESSNHLAHALGKSPQLSRSPQQREPADLIQAPPRPGDLFLLSTDGLSGFLSQPQIAQRLKQIHARISEQPPSPALLSWGSDLLLQDAIERGSNDNISLLLAAVFEQPNNHRPKDPSNANELPFVSSPSLPAIQSTDHPSTFIKTTAPTDRNSQENLVAQQTRPHPPAQLHKAFSLAPLGPVSQPTSMLRERIIWLSFSGLLCALLLFQQVRTKPTLHPLKKRPPVIAKNDGPMILSLRAFPIKHPPPQLKERLDWLNALNQTVATLSSYWRLHSAPLAQARRSLGHRALGFESLHKAAIRLPLESNNFRDFDRQSHRALGHLLKVLSPNLLKHLDEMKRPPQNPHQTLTLTQKNEWKHYRNRLIRRWSKRTTRAGRTHWRLLLLRERFLEHPYSSLRRSEHRGIQDKERVSGALRRCLGLLKRVKEQMPADHVRQVELGQRIALHRAWLKKLSSKDEK